jgi:hypothetical protein
MGRAMKAATLGVFKQLCHVCSAGTCYQLDGFELVGPRLHELKPEYNPVSWILR